jgi:hypothetical protein
VIYALLFRAAADTLLAFGRDARHLGGTIGITAILHTWGQNLSQHLHLHCLVTGGALAVDHSRWIAGRSTFLFPVRALSTVFRAKYLAGLQHAFDAGQLTFAGGTADLTDRRAFAGFLGQLRVVDWIVYAKRPFAGPEQVLDYVGRYTHRVAISNNRLLDIEADQVSFRYKDYRDHSQQKTMTLSAEEFIRRFLLHVLPHGFHRIRYYGFLGNRNRQEKLALCRQLLGMPIPQVRQQPSEAQDYRDRCKELNGVSLRVCPVCRRGHMVLIDTLAARRRPALKDTS